MITHSYDLYHINFTSNKKLKREKIKKKSNNEDAQDLRFYAKTKPKPKTNPNPKSNSKKRKLKKKRKKKN